MNGQKLYWWSPQNKSHLDFSSVFSINTLACCQNPLIAEHKDYGDDNDMIRHTRKCVNKKIMIKFSAPDESCPTVDRYGAAPDQRSLFKFVVKFTFLKVVKEKYFNNWLTCQGHPSTVTSCPPTILGSFLARPHMQDSNGSAISFNHQSWNHLEQR